MNPCTNFGRRRITRDPIRSPPCFRLADHSCRGNDYDFPRLVDFDPSDMHTGSRDGLDGSGHVLLPECGGGAGHAVSTTREPAYGRSLRCSAERRLEIVEAVADWAERGLVVPAVDREGAGRALDRGGGLGQRHDRPALQQPDQSSLVIARQAAVARVRRRRRLVEAEQILGGPAERLGLLAPAGEEATAVLDGSGASGRLGRGRGRRNSRAAMVRRKGLEISDKGVPRAPSKLT